MILTDREIQSAIQTQQIRIDPSPDAAAYSSTSLDLTLAGKARSWKAPIGGVQIAIDPGSDGFKFSEVYQTYTTDVDVPTSGYLLEPQAFLLGWTQEHVSLPSHSRLAARVEGKSSLARLGLGVHITAPTIHAGFDAPLQLEIVNHGAIPIRLRSGMRICQLIFEQTFGTPAKGYAGQFKTQSSG
jgi:dCTP deaminase